LEVVLFEQQLQLAQLKVEKHKFVAPFKGVVAEVLHRPGDWVSVGDPILRVIRLDRLKADGYIAAGQAAQLRDNPEVMLEIDSADGRIQRAGQIVFVSSEIDPVNNEIKFRVEFENPDSDVLPGMRLRLRTRS
jgi:multidrug efflux pump subunit AcrA (membrane-fusion protein)